MKPTEQQDKLLRKYLREIFRYRETYEEVYDHIISSLEHNAYPSTLEEAVNQILHDDFGGYDNLKNIEDKAENMAVKEGVAKFKKYFFNYFRWPMTLHTLALMLLSYYILARIRMSAIAFETIFAIIILIPAILSLRRYYIIGYLFKNTKKSLRDDVFGKLATIPIRLFMFSTFTLIIWNNIWQSANPAILTALYSLSSIYLLALIKLYNNEFKIIL